MVQRTSPSSRKKSCVACRKHKSRCDLQRPCSRCEERKCQCQYDTIDQRDRARLSRLRSLQPHPSGLDDRNQTSPGTSLIDIATNETRNQPDSIFSHSSTVTDLHPAPDAGAKQAQYTFLEPMCNTAFTQRESFSAVESPVTLGDSLTRLLFKMDDLPWLQPDTAQMNKALVPSCPDVSRPIEDADRLLPAALPAYWAEKPLRQRRAAAWDKLMTMKVLVGQILNYPTVMIQGGRMPPFIYPPCAMDGIEAVQACTARGYHVCLPRILAICSNTIKAHAARTPASEAHVWKSIYDFVAEMRRERLNYSAEESLQALQATTLYLLLRAADVESLADNDAKLLISTLAIFAKDVHLSYDYSSSAVADRQEWILRESIRRTMCLVFGIEIFLDAICSPRDSDCDGFSRVPIPSTRELWEPMPNGAWQALFRKSSTKVLVIQDLRLARTKSVGGTASELVGQTKAAISAWCQGVDEFGVLVWMATMCEDFGAARASAAR